MKKLKIFVFEVKMSRIFNRTQTDTIEFLDRIDEILVRSQRNKNLQAPVGWASFRLFAGLRALPRNRFFK